MFGEIQGAKNVVMSAHLLQNLPGEACGHKWPREVRSDMS